MCGHGMECAVVPDRLPFLRCRDGWPLGGTSFCRRGLRRCCRNTGYPACGTVMFLRYRSSGALGGTGFCLNRLGLCHRCVLDGGRCVTNILLDCMTLPLRGTLFGLYGGLLRTAGTGYVGSGMQLRPGFLRCRCDLARIR